MQKYYTLHSIIKFVRFFSQMSIKNHKLTLYMFSSYKISRNNNAPLYLCNNNATF